MNTRSVNTTPSRVLHRFSSHVPASAGGDAFAAHGRHGRNAAAARVRGARGAHHKTADTTGREQGHGHEVLDFFILPTVIDCAFHLHKHMRSAIVFMLGSSAPKPTHYQAPA